MSKREKPTITKAKSFGDETEVQSHPAYGQISAARVHGSVDLYGSNIRHNGFVEVRVMGSREEILHGSRRHYNTVEEMSLWLSEAAWATFISSLNTGSGVPCTIRSKHSGPLVQLPEIEGETYAQKREKEIALAVTRRAEQLKEAVAFFDDLMANGTPKRADLKKFRDMLIQPVDNLASNIVFESRVLNEHSEDLVHEARSEIEAYVTRVAMQFPGLNDTAPKIQQIEKTDVIDSD
jgi:hypothetical protein